MNPLVYLLVVVALSALGLMVLWFRSRPSPASPRSSIEQFSDKMKALAPDDTGEHRETSGRRRRGV
jgi:hypothetical protein